MVCAEIPYGFGHFYKKVPQQEFEERAGVIVANDPPKICHSLCQIRSLPTPMSIDLATIHVAIICNPLPALIKMIPGSNYSILSVLSRVIGRR